MNTKSKPISELPECVYGTKFADRGNLVLKTKEEKAEAEKDSIAAKYIRPYLGAEELVHNKDRWCLWLTNSTPEERKKSPVLRKALEGVKEARKNGEWKEKPIWLPVGEHQPDCDYLAIPRHFSENRAYFTAGYELKDVIASDALFTVEDPDCFAFSVIESSMFMAWQDLVGGRLEMRKRCSNTLVWNTFPLPALTKGQKDRTIEGGAKVLEAKANYPMPPWLTFITRAICLPTSKRPMKPWTKRWTPYFQTSPLIARKRGRRCCLKPMKK